ncbi:MAG: hypothetical protein WC587_02990 [Candidatus Paceibacterota bacterium]
MENEPKKTSSLVVLLTLVVGLVIGFVASSLTGKQSSQQTPEQAKEDTIKAILPSTYNLSGTIKEIKGDEIILDVPGIMGVNIPSDSQLRTRVIVISEATKIYSQTQLSAEEFSAAVERYKKDLAKGLKVTPPPPSTQKEITKGELAAGDNIQVNGGTNQDLKVLLTINALEIIKR